MTKLWSWDNEKFQEVDVDARMLALAASAAQLAVETGDGVIPENLDEVDEGAAFVIPLLIPEGEESGDGRSVEVNALTTRDLPIPLLWQPQTGSGHDGSFIVGRIDTIERIENGLGNARGVFDTGPYGREAQRMVDAKMLRGVSADLDEFEATVDGAEMAGENFEDEVDTIKSEKINIKKARVMAATLVAKPSFQSCAIELATDDAPIEEELPVTDGIYEESPLSTEDQAEYAMSSIIASAAPMNPPESWFSDPGLDGPSPLNVDDEGRVFGHIATWDTEHVGNRGVRPPRSRSGYAYFRTGLIRTEEGSDVSVGQLTLSGGHAALDASAHEAVKHYDDTASAVADVACGEDQFGIWVSGALRPSVTPDQVRAFRASAPSGDWRPINNVLELVAVCQVNVPGFPVARARVASGAVMALVAAGTQTLHRIKTSQVDDLALRLNALEAQILADKKAQLAAQFEPIRRAREQRLAEAAAQARAAFAPQLEERAQLAARRESLISEFKLSVVPDFKEHLHPRDDEGKFRKVLGKLSDLMDGPDDTTGAEEARSKLEEAVKLEDEGNEEGANRLAGQAAEALESAAEAADAAGPKGSDVDGAPAPGDRKAPKARLGDKLHDIASEVAEAVGDAVEDVATGDAAEEAPDIPEEFKELLEHILDEIGEGVDPATIVSRMDNQLRHWLEGKGFQSPEQLAELIAKLLQRPLQPGITQ